jgi:tetratricopeptide (TPR) repeat protein
VAELDDATYDQITRLSEAGNERADAGDLDGALALFGQAWELVPDPKQDWRAATWILAAIGDVSFLKGNYADTCEALQFAMHCPDAIR